VPRGAKDRIRVVVRTVDGTSPTKHITRLIGGMVPANVLDTHERGLEPVVVVSGRLHAEVVIADAALDGTAIRSQIGTLEATVTRLESQLGNPAFVERAPVPVVDEARRRLSEATTQLELLRRRRTGGANGG